MANLAALKETAAARALIVGYPGSAKTGALACLANAGFKLRILDFDGNYEPLLQYCTPEGLANIDLYSAEDKLKEGARYAAPDGEPKAFVSAWRMLDRWKYIGQDGKEVDLGASKTWGSDTIVVVDSLTSMGQAALRRAMFLKGKTPENNTDSTWGFAMAEQEALVEALTSTTNRHHVIVLAHLKMIGPRDLRKGDDDLTQQLKKEAAALVPTRLFPSALGHALPPMIGGHFPILIEAALEGLPGGRVRRVLKTVPRPELDLKVPSPKVAASYDVGDGMLKIFEALGYFPPKKVPGAVEASPATGGASPTVASATEEKLK